jgi:hypothetical protein
MHAKLTKTNTILRQAVQACLWSGVLISIPTVSFAAAPATPSNLIVTSSYYTGTISPIIANVTKLPGKTAGAPSIAVNNNSFPGIFYNTTPDPSFGVTSPIILSTVNPVNGATIKEYNLTDIAAKQLPAKHIVTSFASKSELAINLSTDGKSALTLVAYNSTPGLLDISNSNTFSPIDVTNPTYALSLSTPIVNFSPSTYRTVVQLNKDGSLEFTDTNAYSGNNGRAAILDNQTNTYFLVGNAGNSGTNTPNTMLSNLSDNTGVQKIAAGSATPTTTVIGATQGTSGSSTGYQNGYSVTLDGNAADKTGKDNNFRGATVYNNTLYVSKGSGSNGSNTVYQVGKGNDLDTLNGGTGSSSPITILPGFPNTSAKLVTPTHYPFGIWFASPTVMYVADEGAGGTLAGNTTATISNVAASSANAGLEKWVLESDGKWHNVYTLQKGLNLGVQYTVTGIARDGSTNTGSYTAATDGLRNLAGKINTDGTATLYATTSTISDAGDQGADPNKLVTITDTISATTLPSNATFKTLQTATYGQVLRGVAILPPTSVETFTLPIAPAAGPV